jgi:hypothetical protein
MTKMMTPGICIKMDPFSCFGPVFFFARLCNWLHVHDKRSDAAKANARHPLSPGFVPSGPQFVCLSPRLATEPPIFRAERSDQND